MVLGVETKVWPLGLYLRKFLKDLSSENTRGRKGDGGKPVVSAVTLMSVLTPIYQTSTGQYIAIAPKWSLTAGQSRHRLTSGIIHDKFRQYSVRYNNSPLMDSKYLCLTTRWLYRLHQEICHGIRSIPHFKVMPAKRDPS